MVGQHQQLYEFEQTLRDDEGQRSLVRCSPCKSQRVGHDLATEKNQICRIQKSGTDELICKTETETEVNNKLMDTK